MICFINYLFLNITIMRKISLFVYFFLAIVSIANLCVGCVDRAIWCLLFSFWYSPFVRLTRNS